MFFQVSNTAGLYENEGWVYITTLTSENTA